MIRPFHPLRKYEKVASYREAFSDRTRIHILSLSLSNYQIRKQTLFLYNVTTRVELIIIIDIVLILPPVHQVRHDAHNRKEKLLSRSKRNQRRKLDTRPSFVDNRRRRRNHPSRRWHPANMHFIKEKDARNESKIKIVSKKRLQHPL